MLFTKAVDLRNQACKLLQSFVSEDNGIGDVRISVDGTSLRKEFSVTITEDTATMVVTVSTLLDRNGGGAHV